MSRLHRAVLSSGDAHLILGPDLRAETTVAHAEAADRDSAIELAHTARRLRIGLDDFDHLAECAYAPNPVAALQDGLDYEPRPTMRKALAAAVLAITEGEQ